MPAEVREGHRSRGRTAPGRLVALDGYLLEREQALLRRADGPFDAAPFVDVGIGDTAATTVESAVRLRALAPSLPVVGVDHDRQRIDQARRAHPALRWLELDAVDDAGAVPHARVLRVCNVLRGYAPERAAQALTALGRRVLPGGLLLEGSSDPGGGVLVVQLWRGTGAGARREALLMSTDFCRGFGPWMFRDRLPQALRGDVGPDGMLGGFFRQWSTAFEQVRGGHPDADDRTRFVDSARQLARVRDDVPDDGALFERGQLRLLLDAQ